MTADLRVGIGGDASGLSRAMSEADQRIAQSARYSLQLQGQLNNQLQALDGELVRARLQAMNAQTYDEKQAAQQRLQSVKTLYSEIDSAQKASVAEQEALAKQLTTTMKAQDAQRVTSARTAASEIKTAMQSFAAGAGLGVGVMGGAMLFQQMGQAAKDAVTNFADFGHEVTNLAEVLGTTTENASGLIYQFQQFGLSGTAINRTVVTLIKDMQKNEAEFNQLGIATRGANGELLNGWATFQGMREVLSGAANDTDKYATIMETLARAVSRGGMNIADLAQVFSLTKEQQDKLNQAAANSAQIMSGPQAAAATKLWHELQLLQAEQRGAGLAISEALAPAISWVTEKFLEAIEVVKTYGGIVVGVFSAVTHALMFDFKGAFDIAHQALDDFAKAPTWDEINAKVQEQIDVATKAGQIGEGGTALPPPVTGGGPDLIAQAIEDRIKLIQDEARAQEEAMRDDITAYDRQAQAAIELARTEQKAGQDALQAKIDAARESERLAQEVAGVAIQAIRDEQEAATDAFNVRQQERDGEIAALKSQIALIDAQAAAEKRADDLSKAQGTLAKLQAEEPVRVRSESLAQFATRHAAWAQQLADAETKLSELQITQARNVAKEKISAQINAIEAAGKADKQATDAAKKAGDDRIAQIEKEAKAFKAKTDEAIRQLDRQKTAEKDQSDKRIAQLEEQKKKEDERVADAITALQRQTAATVEELQKQLRAHQRTAARIGALYPNLSRTITYTVTTAGSGPPGGATVNPGENVGESDLITASNLEQLRQTKSSLLGGRPITYEEVAGYLGQSMVTVTRSIFNSAEATAIRDARRPTGGGAGNMFQMATGGSMVLREPTALVGLASGNISAIAAEVPGSAEAVSFGGAITGGRRGGSERFDLHVYLDGAEISARMSQRQYQRYRMQGGDR